ncbi:MAG TPA: hypothetical protein VM911_08300 [Pyrinomonadaceae bacterium]|jgi:hypothetical protein|nr:hypothetical protein [Pyrinomonadaceae bacterium]
MKHRFQSALCLVMVAAVLLGGTGRALTQGQQSAPAARSQQAWTLGEVLAQLKLYPDDAYLQYVALQLARRQNRLEEIAGQIGSMIARTNGADIRTERTNNVDLFSIFTGALAVQESLQLDTMRGNSPARTVRTQTTNTNTFAVNTNANASRTTQQTPRRNRRSRRNRRTASPNSNVALPVPATTELFPQSTPQDAAALEKRRREIVQVSSLVGPTIKSHPWEQMLAGRKPEVSALSKSVPEDFYLVEFRSLGKLLQAMDAGDLWGTHLFNQAYREARTQQVGERLKRQLALETEPALRPFYDLVVKEVAVTGSDPFAREGSDVTILFEVKQPEIFKARMESFLTNAEKANPSAKRSTGQILGVDYVQLETPDRGVSVFAADPQPDLHVRSNSKAALQRVIEAIKGKTIDGQTVRRLGDALEFAYIRTLMPRGAKEEDGLVYMSDPFIRRLVGPQLKLTERRRILCYNHLRMIGHASLLYRTERGSWPTSLEELAQTQTSPGLFNQGELSCPDGGKYSLSEDGTTGLCSRHGRAEFLTPNIEIPVKEVTGAEADEYKAFLEEYNRYWRIYFDPIALRIKMTPQQYRLETIVLPLIDNSLYTNLASVLGGKPEALDPLPVPKRNILSIAARLNKESYLPEVARMERDKSYDQFLRDLGLRNSEAGNINLTEFLFKGLGNQVGLHVYDASPTFDLNMARVLGMLVGGGMGRTRSLGTEELFIGLALASLNTPVYLSFPVQDAQVVDRFMNAMDTALAVSARESARGGWLSFEQDFYKYPLGQDQIYRAYALRIGPLKLRFFWARIGNGLYLASRPFILEDLAAMHAERIRAGTTGVESGGGTGTTTAAGTSTTTAGALTQDFGPEGHAMARMRPQNWNTVLPDFQLSWAENDREACLNNLGALSAVSRALTARAPGAASGGPTGEELDRLVRAYADRFHGVHLFCPEGGLYRVSADGRNVTCNVHGSVTDPRQPSQPTTESAPGRLLRELAGATATLKFTSDGLHAVVVIDRK